MYLSKLEIIGFKSFAQKTMLKFDAGMTSIVGPNGCGKTNVVDAIRWALGEQKAGTLRSDVMENVIFNGTRTRKPLGMAEVSLTIENTKGILPTEYSEVTITRRLFRSGESEYLLNKSQCRLKDIIELFMDTGMGANAYSVIELKMIETILSDRTDERRKLFEEAAGVTKYKARRKEALRRLDQVSSDLERVDDIVKEVTKSVASLERQAEKAKRHAELSEELRALEINLLEREYVTTLSRLEPLRENLAKAETDKTRISDELAKFESVLDVIEREENEIEEQLISSERGVKEKSDILIKTRETIIGTEERIRSLTSQRERAIKDRERLEQELQTATVRVGELAVQLERATTERDGLREEKEQAEQLRRDSEEVVRQRRDELQKARNVVYSLLTNRNQRSNELERRKARIDELERRLNQFTLDFGSFEEKETRLNADHATLTQQVEAARQSVAEKEHDLTTQQEKKDQLKAELDRLQNESFALQNEIGKKLSKIEFFTGLVEQGVGAGEGTEFLLRESGWSTGEPVTVADAMTTQQDLRIAFESALGEVAHYLIVEKSKEAFEAVEMLRHSQKGKATFVCLDRVPASEVNIPELPSGAISAYNAAKYDSRYASLFQLLLAPIAIVNTINDGFFVLDNVNQIDKCVTHDGEVVTREGLVRGGSKRTTEGVLIGKREQIHDLQQEVASLKASLERLEHHIDEANRTFDSIVVRDLSNALRSAEEEKRKVESRLTQVEYELKRLNDERENRRTNEEKTRADLAPLQESLATIAAELEDFDRQHAESNELAARSQLVVEEAEKQLAEQVQRSTEVQVRFAGLSAEVERYESEKEQTEIAIAQLQKNIQDRTNERERVEQELTQFEAKLGEFRTLLTSLEEEVSEMTKRRDEIAEQRKEKQSEAHKFREALREERAQHDKTLSASHELAMKIQDLESKISAIITRAKEEFEIETLERKTFEDEEAFSFGDARESVRDLKQRVKNLGAVNLLAYDEFVKESERLEFLNVQRRDLMDAQKTLVETIEEINETATRQFADTFEKIRGHFQDIFRTLFTEGDECDLKLEDDKDPLEAQIEIIAKPRGKRPHSIELLSGGEKTMTAIALLFAIYLVKPSPFCILDEVDAPLDDANIDRFLQIIKRFAQETQFIVVTHNKRTMAAADALYGVTQEEDGVSKIVSVRLKKESFTLQKERLAAGPRIDTAPTIEAGVVEEAVA